MAPRQDSFFKQFLSPVFNLLLDRDAMLKVRDSIDWQAEVQAISNPQLTYPDYYGTAAFHGIEGGYLTVDAAVTYDPITQYALPPNEDWVRQIVIDAIQGNPRRMLDLGCGTGSSTLRLKQAFPKAEVMGLDLSPHMLIIAQRKAQETGLEILFRHGNALATGLSAASFDVVTASLLFHETPPEIARAILQESIRLLRPGGEVAILDGNQRTLRRNDWLTNIFEEPFIQAYAQGSLDAWMGAAGFGAVSTNDHWWVHQLTHGVKPLPVCETPMEYGSTAVAFA